MNKKKRNTMLSDKTTVLIRNIAAQLCLTFSVTIFCPPVLMNAASEQSYSKEIVRDVAEDKVYLLENLRQKVTLPGEKLILEALLSEDAPQAVTLYQKQLMLYPDPDLDQISRSRIASYTLAMESVAPVSTTSTKPHRETVQDTTKHRQISPAKKSNKVVTSSEETAKSPSPPVKETKQETTNAGKKAFTVRFGTFKSRENAETLAKQISRYVPAETVQQGEFYRVQLKNDYASREEAETEATKLPFKGFVIPAI